MDWKLNLLIGVGAFTLIASVLGSLEQILKFLNWGLRPMLKKWYLRKDTWPLEITIRFTNLVGETLPLLEVVLLIKPRKPVLLGQCEVTRLTNDFKLSPRGLMGGDDFQEWIVGVFLDKPRMYTLSFFAPGVELGHEIQIEVEAEGYVSKSNILAISSPSSTAKLGGQNAEEKEVDKL